MRRILGVLLLLALLTGFPLSGQQGLAGAGKIIQSLDRLNVLGSVLMIAAHPDDENTALLAYLAKGRKYRAAYLAMTRGEGGQNLIGPEQGDLMGVIRTRELLAARRIDGAEQFFTRAIDFGYSKTARETLAKWDRDAVLSDIVWVIRRVRPDVIVLRFSGTPRDGHGHHQSSAILAKEAFRAAADPNRFPEQLQYVRPWQAKRIFWNVFSFRRGRFTNESDQPGRIDIDAGEFNPVLGYSYAEIAGQSRSQHKSQGFGAPQRKGPAVNSLVLVAGEPARKDLMDGVDTTWQRIPGGEAAGAALAKAAKAFLPEKPEKTIPYLLEARAALAHLDDPWVQYKRKQLDKTIALCAGLWLDAAAARYNVTPGSQLGVTATALNRSHAPVELLSFALDGQDPETAGEQLSYNQPHEIQTAWQVPAEAPYSQPYWLRRPPKGALYDIADPRMIGNPDTPPVVEGRFRVRIGGQEIEYRRPVHYRWVDRVRGELTRLVAVVPAVSVSFVESPAIFTDRGPRTVEVELDANVDHAAGEAGLLLPGGWSAAPRSIPFQLAKEGEQKVVRFTVTAPAGESVSTAKAVATVAGRRISAGDRVIDYPHIPPQTLSPPATARLVHVEARNLARRVGYVMGAGDDVPAAIRQLGAEVTLLEAADLSAEDLARFDAIVTGVRAYNVRSDLRANQQRLLEYVHNGGTLVVQYNVISRRRGPGQPDPLANLGPYPLTISHDRVSVEEATMKFLHPDHPVLQRPNRISERDFDGWIQERGLYFASQWDDHYTPLWEAHDPGEDPLSGDTLYVRYGKGVYIYTSLSFFRELPAGVPGAYRIFANFISAGRAAR